MDFEYLICESKWQGGKLPLVMENNLFQIRLHMWQKRQECGILNKQGGKAMGDLVSGGNRDGERERFLHPSENMGRRWDGVVNKKRG